MVPTSRLGELERMNNWLLALSAWRLRRLALLIALAINVPNAWTLYRSGPDTELNHRVADPVVRFIR